MELSDTPAQVGQVSVGETKVAHVAPPGGAQTMSWRIGFLANLARNLRLVGRWVELADKVAQVAPLYATGCGNEAKAR